MLKSFKSSMIIIDKSILPVVNPNSYQNEARIGFYGIIGGIWALMACYAVLQDQYLVRIAPEHFTEYHPNPLQIQSAPWLAAFIALQASVSPGLALGVASWFVGRFGRAPKLKAESIFKLVFILLILTELAGSLSGWYAYQTGSLIYSKTSYPSLTKQMITTQTIQLTCYNVALIGSPIFLWRMRQMRNKLQIPS